MIMTGTKFLDLQPYELYQPHFLNEEVHIYYDVNYDNEDDGINDCGDVSRPVGAEPDQVSG